MSFFVGVNRWFFALGASVLICFLCLRPLNAPHYRMIVADGLGYYAYLPAQFIYADQELNFHWFDTVFNRHYNNHLFAKPTDNFMVALGDRQINKYYPGQSLLQLPFFLMGHLGAVLLHYPADGFSQPYQISMGLAAVFYALLGLFFCYKLLFLVFHNRRLAMLVPPLIFFGSHLFTYTIFSGCYSHVYSFCFIGLTYYSAFLFFNTPDRRLLYFLLAALCSVIVLTLRPLNVVLLLGAFYFYKPFPIRELFAKKNNGWAAFGLLALILFVLGYSLSIMYTQTHSFFVNTYQGERFYFNNWGHIKDNFIGFQCGILWYSPLLILCLAAAFLCFRFPRLLFLIGPVLALIVIYSFWWYWNIAARTLVDCSVPLSLLLAQLLTYFKAKRSYKWVLLLALLCVPFFQLKAYQLRAGILDNNYTYFKYYVKHFFTLHTVNVFPVNPATVLEEKSYFQDFEQAPESQVAPVKRANSQKSAVLNQQAEFAATTSYTVPLFMNKPGFKKIKASFWIYAGKEIDTIHFIFTFVRGDSSVAYLPFYMQGKNLRKEQWELKEFGCDLPDSVRPGDVLKVYFWNPAHKNAAFVDDLKLEFFLTDGSDEVSVK